MKCQTCRFYAKSTHDHGHGDCRRHVPTVLMWNGHPHNRWPQVSFTDWCGEYEDIPEPPRNPVRTTSTR